MDSRNNVSPTKMQRRFKPHMVRKRDITCHPSNTFVPVIQNTPAFTITYKVTIHYVESCIEQILEVEDVD